MSTVGVGKDRHYFTVINYYCISKILFHSHFTFEVFSVAEPKFSYGGGVEVIYFCDCD